MAEATQKAQPQLEPARFKPAESSRNVHSITIEQGISRAEILNPAFLAHIAARLRPYDHIEVTCDDGTLYAELLVKTCDRTWAHCHVLKWEDLTTRDVSLSQATAKPEKAKGNAPVNEDFRVEYKGQHKKWCVIRNLDNQFVREDEENKENAQHWLREYLKVTT